MEEVARRITVDDICKWDTVHSTICPLSRVFIPKLKVLGAKTPATQHLSSGDRSARDRRSVPRLLQIMHFHLPDVDDKDVISGATVDIYFLFALAL